jgi:HD-like signal output (HDOD) protein
MNSIDKETAQTLLKGFVIPPRPEVLTRFNEEKNKPAPNLKTLADIVSMDPGISASLIKTINSPIFGSRRKIASVHEAVSLLGISSMDNIVTSLALIAANGKQVNLERFWDTAMDVANISRSLAKNIIGVSDSDAFTLGMFHDCGIAMMMQRMPDYKQLLSQANNDTENTLTALEDQRYQTNHATIGFLVAKAWNMPEHICLAIQMHHEHIDFGSPLAGYDERILPLLAILKMAQHLNHICRNTQDSDGWTQMGASVLDYLGIGADEFEEIETEMRQNSTVTPQAWIAKSVDP